MGRPQQQQQQQQQHGCLAALSLPVANATRLAELQALTQRKASAAATPGPGAYQASCHVAAAADGPAAARRRSGRRPHSQPLDGPFPLAAQPCERSLRCWQMERNLLPAGGAGPSPADYDASASTAAACLRRAPTPVFGSAARMPLASGGRCGLCPSFSRMLQQVGPGSRTGGCDGSSGSSGSSRQQELAGDERSSSRWVQSASMQKPHFQQQEQQQEQRRRRHSGTVESTARATAAVAVISDGQPPAITRSAAWQLVDKAISQCQQEQQQAVGGPHSRQPGGVVLEQQQVYQHMSHMSAARAAQAAQELAARRQWWLDLSERGE